MSNWTHVWIEAREFTLREEWVCLGSFVRRRRFENVQLKRRWKSRDICHGQASRKTWGTPRDSLLMSKWPASCTLYPGVAPRLKPNKTITNAAIMCEEKKKENSGVHMRKWPKDGRQNRKRYWMREREMEKDTNGTLQESNWRGFVVQATRVQRRTVLHMLHDPQNNAEADWEQFYRTHIWRLRASLDTSTLGFFPIGKQVRDRYLVRVVAAVGMGRLPGEGRCLNLRAVHLLLFFSFFYSS